jgi:hypothetical protein
MGFFSRSEPRLYRLLYLMNDAILQDEWIERSAIDRGRVDWFRERLPADGVGAIEMESPLGSLQVKITAPGAYGLVTAYLAGRPILSSVVLAESDAEAGAELARSLVESLRRTKPVRDSVADTDHAFARILTSRERPFVGSVHWPIVTAEQFARLGPLDVEYAAALVWREPNG